MQVRPKKAPATRKMPGGQPTEKPPAQSFTFPAPIRGWVLNENLASPQPGGARVLDNWVCTTTGIRVRGGAPKYATLPDAVVSVFPYRAGTDALFAATTTGIFDATTIIDANVALTPDVTGQTSGTYSTAQFGTAGGDFLYAVNGADDAQLYDGTVWTQINGASVPAVTGVLTSDLIHVWTHANRIWFVQRNTLNAWYLPVDSIAGAAVQFSLAGVFTKGGTLLFGAKWSLSAGDGLDDKCVFVTSEGEVAVYEGTNPSSAATWRLAGRYDMPKPIGSLSYIQAGGDLLIATDIGLIPVSAAINSDLGAIEAKAVSRPIAPYWIERARDIGLTSWQMAKVHRSGIMVVSQPATTGSFDATCLVINLITGAWSRFTGWDTQCLCEFAGGGVFGSTDGCLYLMDTSGSDNGALYTAAYLGLHDAMGVYGQEKTVLQMRPMLQAAGDVNPLVSAKVNFNQILSPPPASPVSYVEDLWDVGLWDVAVWDSAVVPTSTAAWTAIGLTGTFVAPELQLTFGVASTPRVEYIGMDAQFRVGAAVA